MSAGVAAAEVFVSAKRWGPWRVAAVVALLVVLVTVAAVGLVTPAGGWWGEPVLVVARPVPVGQLITAADVRVERLRLPRGVARVPAGTVEQVVGRPAAVPLAAGMLLAPEHVGAVQLPVGQALTAVAVPAPPSGLTPGCRVRVLVADRAAADGGGAGVAVWATVVAVEAGEGAAGAVVSLLLPRAQAERLAAAAAGGSVALVVGGAG